MTQELSLYQQKTNGIRRFLVTFSGPGLCIPVGQDAVFSHSAIVETPIIESPSLNRSERVIPDQFTIVGLPNGRKLDKPLTVHVLQYVGFILGAVEIGQDEAA